MLWICDVALCTYVRCSHDSKSSPHPPSAICLERRNWQAWVTSWHAALQGQGRESDRAGDRERLHACVSHLQTGAVLCPAHGCGTAPSLRLGQQVCWLYGRHRIWEKLYLGLESPCAARASTQSHHRVLPRPKR